MQNDIAHANKRFNENINEAQRSKEKRLEGIRREASKQVTQIQLHPPKDGALLEIVNEIYRKQVCSLAREEEEEEESD